MTAEESLGVLRELGFRGLVHTKSQTSSVTTTWGVDWDADLIARDLMQNFFDANRDCLDQVIVSTKGTLVRVTAPTIYELERLFFLGSEKGPGDVGQYGEGFKAAAVCVLRTPGVVLAAASQDQVVRIRIDSKPAVGDELFPLVYDFFTTPTSVEGNVLIIRGASAKLAEAMRHGLDHFFHEGNRLIGQELMADGDRFRVFRSRTEDGHMFYRNLKRGSIPGVPLVLVLNKEYAALERRIKSDRDRKAFDEAVRDTFYSVWARSFFVGRGNAVTMLLESARGCWEKGEGHPLLSNVARYVWPGDSQEWQEVFGSRFYAKSHPRSLPERIEYESIEREWEQEGRRSLPGYFDRFGVPSAEGHIRDTIEKARRERREKEQRGLTPAETLAIAVLTDVLRSLAPTLAALIENRRTKYTVAETEALLGEFRQGRSYASPEVYLSAEVFVSDFARALAVFLHEHSHTFGYDGSRGFTDALTELLELVVRYRDLLAEAETKWCEAVKKVVEERSGQNGDMAVETRDIDLLSETELRALLKALPESVQRELLRSYRAKSHAPTASHVAKSGEPKTV